VSVAVARRGDLWVAVTAAALLHVLAFVLLVALALVEIIVESKQEASRPPIDDRSSVTVELSPDLFQRIRERTRPQPQPEPEEITEPKERSFAKTAPEQEVEEQTEPARFIGERDTAATSERPMDPGIKRMPSQDGEEPRMEGHVSTFDSNFTPGEEPAASTSDSLPPETPAGVPTEAEDGEDETVVAEVKPAPDEGRPKEMILQSENQVQVPSREGEKPTEPEEELPKEEEAESEAQLAKRGESGTGKRRVDPRPREPGFRTQSRKTRIRGSFTRHGKSSLDVDNTLVGRYQARVSRALENEWQKKCIIYRDHITPGILTIRFFVNETGGVSGLRYLDVLEASEIQKGFTVNAIRDAPIPAMPKDVAKELAGEPLELVINFLF
jgi:hypothetical protein